jgi:DNA-binding NtrC family response regulator
MKPRILLVEDDIASCSKRKRLLRQRGYDVASVASRSAALRLLGRQHFHLIVLAVEMSGPDGPATLEAIQQQGRSADLLLVTGHDSLFAMLQAERPGAYECLAKPVTTAKLLNRIQTLLTARGIRTPQPVPDSAAPAAAIKEVRHAQSQSIADRR